MPGDVNGIARFRADPRKIRVAIRRDGDHWRATVAYLNDPDNFFYVGWAVDPKSAINEAMGKAIRSYLDGIDKDMDHAYDHPMHVAKDMLIEPVLMSFLSNVQAHNDPRITGVKHLNQDLVDQVTHLISQHQMERVPLKVVHKRALRAFEIGFSLSME